MASCAASKTPVLTMLAYQLAILPVCTAVAAQRRHMKKWPVATPHCSGGAPPPPPPPPPPRGVEAEEARTVGGCGTRATDAGDESDGGGGGGDDGGGGGTDRPGGQRAKKASPRGVSSPNASKRDDAHHARLSGVCGARGLGGLSAGLMEWPCFHATTSTYQKRSAPCSVCVGGRERTREQHM